ncbi:hypothetical protein [Streptomyces sp. NPDC003635]
MVLIVSPFTSIVALALAVGVTAVVLGMIEVFQAIRMRVEVGRLAPSATAAQLRSLCHQPHPQH